MSTQVLEAHNIFGGVFMSSRNKRKYPRYLEADVERGFIYAYYELVCGMKVSLSGPREGPKECVALARKPGLMVGMDFSTHYESESMKFGTLLKRVRQKVEDLRYWSAFQADVNNTKTEQVLYEIWCFIPPSERVCEMVDRALKEDLPVKLVSLEEVGERLLQTAAVEPEETDSIYQNAFLWTVKMFRNTGALGKYSLSSS